MSVPRIVQISPFITAALIVITEVLAKCEYFELHPYIGIVALFMGVLSLTRWHNSQLRFVFNLSTLLCMTFVAAILLFLNLHGRRFPVLSQASWNWGWPNIFLLRKDNGEWRYLLYPLIANLVYWINFFLVATILFGSKQIYASTANESEKVLDDEQSQDDVF